MSTDEGGSAAEPSDDEEPRDGRRRDEGGKLVADRRLSCANPNVVAHVRSWCVQEEVETLSDHRYIRIEISRTLRQPSRGHTADAAPAFPRWAVDRLDRDPLAEATIVRS